MNNRENALKHFDEWYGNLKRHKSSGGPARGTIGAALVVLEHLKSDYNLELDHHRAHGKSQIRGASGGAVKKILATFGEHRPYLSEGGRTNRGAPADVGAMLATLDNCRLVNLPENERVEVLNSLQQYLVEKIREFHNRQRLKLEFNPDMSLWHTVNNLLNTARDHGKDGAVAQYLVGAKLQKRFPDIKVGNQTFSTADEQLGRPGDFYIGDTSFHVTVAPVFAVFDKCKINLQNGYRVYLVVPDRRLSGARENSEDFRISDRIAIESIESFVSQNVEELSVFSRDRLLEEFLDLLNLYNERVDAIENDKSMMIEIPVNLKKNTK